MSIETIAAERTLRICDLCWSGFVTASSGLRFAETFGEDYLFLFFYNKAMFLLIYQNRMNKNDHVTSYDCP